MTSRAHAQMLTRPRLAIREMVDPLAVDARRQRLAEIRARSLLLDPADLQAMMDGEQYADDIGFLLGCLDDMELAMDQQHIPRDTPVPEGPQPLPLPR